MAEKVKQYRHPDDPITLDEFKSFLWAAATHLRGQIDAAGYKEYLKSATPFPKCYLHKEKWTFDS